MKMNKKIWHFFVCTIVLFLVWTSALPGLEQKTNEIEQKLSNLDAYISNYVDRFIKENRYTPLSSEKLEEEISRQLSKKMSSAEVSQLLQQIKPQILRIKPADVVRSMVPGKLKDEIFSEMTQKGSKVTVHHLGELFNGRIVCYYYNKYAFSELKTSTFQVLSTQLPKIVKDESNSSKYASAYGRGAASLDMVITIPIPGAPITLELPLVEMPVMWRADFYGEIFGTPFPLFIYPDFEKADQKFAEATLAHEVRHLLDYLEGNKIMLDTRFRLKEQEQLKEQWEILSKELKKMEHPLWHTTGMKNKLAQMIAELKEIRMKRGIPVQLDPASYVIPNLVEGFKSGYMYFYTESEKRGFCEHVQYLKEMYGMKLDEIQSVMRPDLGADPRGNLARILPNGSVTLDMPSFAQSPLYDSYLKDLYENCHND